MHVDSLSTSLNSQVAVNSPTVVARAGDFVLIRTSQKIGPIDDGNWWMGQVVFCDIKARDHQFRTMLQISDVEDGRIHWVKSDQVQHIVRSLDGLQVNV